MHINHNTGS